MNVKLLLTVFAVMLACIVATAQTKESTDSLSRELQEVLVTARQPATRLVGTTLVSTIAGSNLADIGNALDVLAQLPMIQVHDNAVSVIGKSNIEIYIDGRPMRDDMELQQLMSSNVRRVELQMAPGAAYDSTTGAVLRITTRRDFAPGLSLTDQFNLQRRRRWSVMDYLALSYNTCGWEFFANGTINSDNVLAKGTTTNSLVYDGRETIVGGSQHSKNSTTVGVIKAGFNYVAGTQSLGAYYRYNPERGKFANTGSEWLDDEPALDRMIDKSTHAQSHLVSTYYDNTFADRYHLHFDGDYRQSVADNDIATSYPDASVSEVKSTDRRTSSLWAAKLYMDFPLWRGSFTVGTQDSYTHTTLDYRMLNERVGEYIPSALTDARQASAALFATWARLFGHFNMSVGARYEYVDYDFKVDGRRDEDVSRRDHLLTPDLTLGYIFNDDAQFSLSYKMSTVKPPYSQLTGALSYVGRHEIEGGDPSLADEHLHDVQLFGLWKDFMFQANYMRSFDTYAYVKQLYPARDIQLLMHPVNIDVTALSVYLVWSKPIRRWTPNVTACVYRQWLTLDNCRHDSPIVSYYFDNTFSLPGGWLLTANFSGSTRGDMHTNRFGATWLTMDASIGRTFFNKSLNVKLTATDIFNTANNDWTMNTNGIFVDKRQSYDRRGLALTVIYKFRPRKNRYKGESASEAEVKRL